jgi:Flp pilus assembly protein TadB
MFCFQRSRTHASFSARPPLPQPFFSSAASGRSSRRKTSCSGASEARVKSRMRRSFLRATNPRTARRRTSWSTGAKLRARRWRCNATMTSKQKGFLTKFALVRLPIVDFAPLLVLLLGVFVRVFIIVVLLIVLLAPVIRLTTHARRCRHLQARRRPPQLQRRPPHTRRRRRRRQRQPLSE